MQGGTLYVPLEIASENTAANFRVVINVFLLQQHDIKISELCDCFGCIRTALLPLSCWILLSWLLFVFCIECISPGLQDFHFHDLVVVVSCLRLLKKL